ncbi:hypothetical protein BLNAU_4921 [Blattamonas nauphoetae]|uniref:Uncharacterized protein n=1 Tax=Blattamonas nauphoetae TaxID=2049346 RepID=A0ABQ9Y8M5_9EUKA|nr:hypothetical protein BLNAU_4921 [Blattamonas nauphoetae]
MNDESVTLSSSIDACLSVTFESHPTVTLEEELFLDFVSNSKMLFEDKSRIYNSLVALVKAGYPFDKTLQDRAAQFLKNVEQELRNEEEADQLVTDFVHSSSGPLSGFVDSIVTLMSSPHSTMIAAALSFLQSRTKVSGRPFLHL